MSANLPSLMVAQILYGDATREPDLTARNNAVNPRFFPLTLKALAQ
jgi:prophage DNA circulation protein